MYPLQKFPPHLELEIAIKNMFSITYIMGVNSHGTGGHVTRPPPIFWHYLRSQVKLHMFTIHRNTKLWILCNVLFVWYCTDYICTHWP